MIATKKQNRRTKGPSVSDRYLTRSERKTVEFYREMAKKRKLELEGSKQ